MGRMVWGQNNFSSGQIGQSLMAGTDLKEYSNGAEFIKNFVPLKTRGLGRRTGTRFLKDITSTGASRLVAIRSNSSFGDLILGIKDSTSAGQANPFQFYQSDGTAITTGFSFSSMTISTALAPATIAKEEWTYTVVGNILILTHLSNSICPLVCDLEGIAGLSSISVGPLISGLGIASFQPPLNEGLLMPYRPQNIDSSHTMTPSATSGAGITITSSVNFFDSEHVGTYIKITHGGTTTGIAKIVGYTSATQVTADVVINFSATTASDRWEEGAWSNYRGWPGMSTAFNNRLVYATTAFDIDSLWNSAIGNIFLMMNTKLAQDSASDASGIGYFGALADDDAFDEIVNSQEANYIQWICSGRGLQVGTEEAEFLLKGTNGKYGPLNVDIDDPSANGGSPVRPVKKGKSTYYVSADGKSLYEFLYQESNGSFLSRDITTISDDIVYHNIDESAEEYSKTAFKELVKNKSLDVIYGLTNNDELVGVALKEGSDQIAWHTYDFDCDAVHGVACLPTESNSFHNTYVCVERTINGGTKYYIEYMSQPYQRNDLDSGSSDDDEYPWYLDSAKKVTGSAFTTVTGLTHLVAEQVRVLGDGADLGTYTVDGSGEIELTTAVDVAIVGREFTSYLRTLSPTVGSIFGDSTPFIKSINKTVLRLLRSLGGLWRSSDLDQDNPMENEYSDIQGTELFTGDLKIDAGSTPGIRQFIEIETSDPFPMNVLGIFYRGEVSDGR